MPHARNYIYLIRRIGEWSSDLDDSGCWSGISDYEAMRRLDIMIGNSYCCGDIRFDGQIERSTSSYFDRIMDSDCADSRTLFYLYR